MMKETADFTEKKAFERMPESFEVRLFCCNMFYSGTTLNLSPKGMLIRTAKGIPAASIFLVLFRINNKLLKVLVKVKEAIKQADYYYGIEVEVMNHNKYYLEFIENIKADQKAARKTTLI